MLYLPPEKPVCRSRSNIEPDMEQLTGSTLGNEYNKSIYCHPVALTYVQSISCEMLDWLNHRLKSRLPREISITSDMQMIHTTLIAQSEEELKSLLMKVKEESEKVGSAFRKRRSWHPVPSLHGK